MIYLEHIGFVFPKTKYADLLSRKVPQNLCYQPFRDKRFVGIQCVGAYS